MSEYKKLRLLELKFGSELTKLIPEFVIKLLLVILVF